MRCGKLRVAPHRGARAHRGAAFNGTDHRCPNYSGVFDSGACSTGSTHRAILSFAPTGT